ncbi:MAG: Rrf2 family transcriptional regulator [Proteobacteria bacterium]|nr:Rrf2 family transcriptional regulator [Pseudomonadota bacterium]
MLKNKTKYAIKAVIELAKAEKDTPVRIEDIARSQNIPKKFLELILIDLRCLGLLQSKKGKGGGYFLTRKADKANVGDIIRHFEGPLALLPCASVTQFKTCDDCRNPNECTLRLVMRKVRDEAAKVLDHVPIYHLANIKDLRVLLG